MKPIRYQPILFASMRIVMVAGLLLMAWPAEAQEGPESQEGTFIPKELEGEAKEGEEEVKTGWDYLLRLSANFALNHSKRVVGAPDGTNMNFGMIVTGALDYLSENTQHEWLNSLNWQLGFSKTPVIDDVYKNVDGLDFETVYLYHLPPAPWLGPFAAFQLKTVVFPSYAIFGTDANVYYYSEAGGAPEDADGNVLTDADGDTVIDPVVVPAQTRIELTDAFAPTTLRESLGIFAIPVDKPLLKLEARLGFGFWETFVRNGYTIADYDADILEIVPMQDVVELGPELRIGATGHINKFVNYGARALFMLPVYQTVETDLETMEKLNMEFDFNLGVKLWDWASIDYIFKAYKLPMIFNDWQVMNALLVSINFSIVSDNAEGT